VRKIRPNMSIEQTHPTPAIRTPGVRAERIELPNGIALSLRVAGQPGAPSLLFLHGFPEGAFVWDGYLAHFASLGFFCVAPNLRGFEHSSAPEAVEAYRAKHLVQDVAQLAQAISPSRPLHALVAHDWGGAVAWNAANQLPQLMQRLFIVNSPHPAPFLRDLQRSPAQRAASTYMVALAEPDAAATLAANSFTKLWQFFDGMGGPRGWLTPERRADYESIWSLGLRGPCNYYQASPLRPDKAAAIQLPNDMLRIAVPTTLAWGMDDTALLSGLLDGLEPHIPDLRIERLNGATHWVLHEQPKQMKALMHSAFSGNLSSSQST
jgi:epoxide hydrolase 4